MTPAEAAFTYLHLEVTLTPADAIAFALSYENIASTEDFAEYLDILENKLSNLAA